MKQISLTVPDETVRQIAALALRWGLPKQRHNGPVVERAIERIYQQEMEESMFGIGSKAEFATRADAEAAGYVTAECVKAMCRGTNYRVADASGDSSYGYRYEVREIEWDGYENADGDMVRYTRDVKTVARSHTVWLTEGPNKLGGKPAFTAMFKDNELPF